MQFSDIRSVVMRRREFLLKAAVLCTAIAAPMVGWIRQAEDTSIVRALPGNLYPGPVRPLDKKNVSRPGKWAG